jgi:SAM-dependent methyltransferase
MTNRGGIMIDNTNREKWDEKRARAWHLFMPPARPSEAEVTIYEHALKNENDRQKAIELVVLGATPELRSLAHRFAAQLTCVDFNETVFSILFDMVSPKGKEEFYCCDWKTMDVNRKFSMVFGDGSINMLHPSQHEPFLNNMSELLVPGGIAVVRVHVINPPAFTEATEVFQWYRNNKIQEPLFTATRNHLDMLWMNRNTMGIDFNEFHNKLRKMLSDRVITDDEFGEYDRLLEYNRITLYYCEREGFEKLVCEQFKIEQVLYGKDHLSHLHHPIYYLRKN